MTDEETIARVTAQLTGEFYPGMRVRGRGEACLGTLRAIEANQLIKHDRVWSVQWDSGQLLLCLQDFLEPA